MAAKYCVTLGVLVPTAGSRHAPLAIAGVAVDAAQPAGPRHLLGGVADVVDGSFVQGGFFPVGETPNAPAGFGSVHQLPRPSGWVQLAVGIAFPDPANVPDPVLQTSPIVAPPAA